MGGVNLTRNRAWWHTAIWDEYGQRHQYLCFIPTFLFMFPTYWYGSFINRALEQNWGAKMYQLEFENRRNRLTHNMIMEHFESHVEKVQDILDDIKSEGFEKAFEHEIKNPFTETIKDEIPDFKDEYFAELAEYVGLTSSIDELLEHKDLPYWQRVELEKLVPRRKTPVAEFTYLNQHRLPSEFPVFHTYLDPYKSISLTKEGTSFKISEESEQ